MSHKIPKSRYHVGERVNVKCVEAGCPPIFEATIISIDVNHVMKGELEYCVQEDDGFKTDGYSEEWLTPLPDESQTTTIPLVEYCTLRSSNDGLEEQCAVLRAQVDSLTEEKLKLEGICDRWEGMAKKREGKDGDSRCLACVAMAAFCVISAVASSQPVGFVAAGILLVFAYLFQRN